MVSTMKMPVVASDLSARAAFRFIVLMGVISLLADMTYESARSLNGPFLNILGASAAAVGVAAGAGELLGYGLRFFTGYLADRTKRYWLIVFLGYGINLLAVPALSLAGRWEVAVVLMFVERIGKAIRNPARDAMISHAACRTGAGRGFALHEALDQIGAISGPLIMGGILLAKRGAGIGSGDFQRNYALLLIPALFALSVLAFARFRYPRPSDLECPTPRIAVKGFHPAYWWYVAGAALIGAGFADFPLMAYHFGKKGLIEVGFIPVLYAAAMAVDAVSALVLGRWFDRAGFPVLVAGFGLSSLFAPLAFLGGRGAAVAGVVLWGVGMGAQESIMKAAVASLLPPERRATGFGLYHTGFGVFWFLGSVLMGILYDVSPPALAAFSMTAQLAAIPLVLVAGRKSRPTAQ